MSGVKIETLIGVLQPGLLPMVDGAVRADTEKQQTHPVSTTTQIHLDNKAVALQATKANQVSVPGIKHPRTRGG